MTDDRVDTVIRQAIGGDVDAISWIAAHADTVDDRGPARDGRLSWNGIPVASTAPAPSPSTSRDRQVVEIARAHLDGERELVDALARDHLVDYPDSLIVAGSPPTRSPTSRHEGPI